MKTVPAGKGLLMSKVSYCSNCEKKIPSDADVCPHCGIELDEGGEL